MWGENVGQEPALLSIQSMHLASGLYEEKNRDILNEIAQRFSTRFNL